MPITFDLLKINHYLVFNEYVSIFRYGNRMSFFLFTANIILLSASQIADIFSC